MGHRSLQASDTSNHREKTDRVRLLQRRLLCPFVNQAELGALLRTELAQLRADRSASLQSAAEVNAALRLERSLEQVIAGLYATDANTDALKAIVNEWRKRPPLRLDPERCDVIAVSDSPRKRSFAAGHTGSGGARHPAQ